MITEGTLEHLGEHVVIAGWVGVVVTKKVDLLEAMR